MESLLDIVRFAFAFFFGRRVHLIAFYGSGGALELPAVMGAPGAIPPGTQINHHSLVIQNIGRATAHNVRVGHLSLAGVNYRVTNAVPTMVRSEAPSTEVEFVIPVIPAGYQVSIDYLYFPPTTFETINNYVTCDEGVAEVRTLLHAWRMSNSMKLAITAIGITSLVALVTALYFFIPWFADWIKNIFAKI